MNEDSPHIPAGYRLDDVTIDLARRRVMRGDQHISLGKLSYRLLVALAKAAPNVLTQDDLVEQVWDGRYVNPATIKQRIVMLRQALGDDASKPRYLGVVRGHGYSLIPTVETLFEVPGSRPRRSIYLAAVLTGAIAIVSIYLASTVAPPPARPPSIAVLPFDNLSSEPENSFFATGLHEELIDRLTQIDDLRVVSRSSVQQYAGSAVPVAQIARDLDVDAVMTGTVEYQDGRVRIRTRLIGPEDGSQLWSNAYERDFADIFEIQRNIAESVAGALGVRLGIRESDAFRGAGTTNVDAYEAFLAGLHVLGQAQGVDRAIAFFSKATELDRDYATAWALLGFSIASKSFYSPPDQVQEILDRAMQPLLTAVELDPDSSRAASILGFVRYSRLDWVGAENDYTRAMDLKTSRDTLRQHAGMLVRAGRMAAARSEFSAADMLERSSEQPGMLAVQIEIAQRRYTEARLLASSEGLAILRNRLLLNIALNEGDGDTIRQGMSEMIAVEGVSSTLFAPLLQEFDAPDRALALLRAVHDDRNTRWPAKQHDVALLAAYFGDPELALESIAEEARLSTVRLWALWYPIMSDVRQLPEFNELADALGLVAYWRRYGWPDACTPLTEGDFRCF